MQKKTFFQKQQIILFTFVPKLILIRCTSLLALHLDHVDHLYGRCISLIIYCNCGPMVQGTYRYTRQQLGVRCPMVGDSRILSLGHLGPWGTFNRPGPSLTSHITPVSIHIHVK